MKIFTLHRIQKLPINQEQAWDFLSDPHNLGRITPEVWTLESSVEQIAQCLLDKLLNIL